MPTTHTDVLIIGAGPAGLAAAVELKRQGVRDLLVVEREAEAGGLPRLCDHLGFGWPDLRRVFSGPGYARHYRGLAQAAGVAIRPQTAITGWAGPTAVTYTSPEGLGEIAARTVLLATGCRERPRAARLVPGSRPAGVFTTGSLQRFVHEQHLPVGRRAVIVGAELVSLSALLTLRQAGTATVAFLDEQPRPQLYFPYNVAQLVLADGLYQTPVLSRVQVTAILGRPRVEAVEATHLDTGRVERIACDTVVFTGGWIPEHELARLGGLAMDPGTRGPRLDGAFRTSRPGVFAAGNLLRGAETAGLSALEGRRAAGQMVEFLRGQAWPAPGLPITVEAPLSWICPNLFDPAAPLAGLRFRSAAFRERVRVSVYQGERRLQTQRFRQLVVNDSLALDPAGLHQADPAGAALRVVVEPAPGRG